MRTSWILPLFLLVAPLACGEESANQMMTDGVVADPAQPGAAGSGGEPLPGGSTPAGSTPSGTASAPASGQPTTSATPGPVPAGSGGTPGGVDPGSTATAGASGGATDEPPAGAGAPGQMGGAGGNGQSGSGGMPMAAGSGGAPDDSGAAFPFPVNAPGEYCTYPADFDLEIVRDAYEDWKTTTVTSEGASGFLRVRKPDSGSVIDSTVSEGIGYGMLLAVYMNDQDVFDNLWQYTLMYLDEQGLMHWEIDPGGNVIGTGAASDGDEDMAWALVMADVQWGGQGSLDRPYIDHATDLINAMWDHEVDHSRGDMLLPGDQWGGADVTNISYYAPAYYRVFGQVTGMEAEWNAVVDSSYRVIDLSLNAASGNVDNGLVPAWCNSEGTPVEAYGGAPLHFQQDSTRTPFRVGQDYCYFGEPRAKAYLEKITSFYQGVGVANIVDGYELDGTPRPERAVDGLQSASFVGPAGVGAMNDPMNQVFVDEAYAAVATLGLSAGTIYYQKSWTALSLLMLTGNFVDLTAL